MRDRKSVAKWNLFFHYSATVIAIVNGLAIVPFYLKFIDHALFGAWLATGNVLVWLTIVEPGVGDVLQQKVAAAIGEKKNDDAGKFILSGIIISFAISVLILLGSIIVSNFIPSILNLSSSIDQEQLVKAFNIAAFATCFTILSYAFVGSNQGLLSSVGIGLIYLVANVGGIVLNIYLLFNNYGVLSIAYATLFRSFTLCLGNILYLGYRVKNQNIKLGVSKAFFINFSKLFSYTFFSKISNTIVSNIDLIIIARFVNPETVTMLELTRRPIRILQGFTDRVSVAFMGPLANLKGEGNYGRIKSIFIRFIYIYTWISTLVIFGFIALNEQLLYVWAGDSVFIGNEINILLCITLLLSSLAYNFSNFNYAMGNIKGNSTISINKSVVYLIFIFILAYFFGVIGVVMATLISVMSTELWYHPKRLNSYLHFSKNEITTYLKEVFKVLILGIFVSSSFLLLKLRSESWFDLIALALIFAIIYMALLFTFSLSIRVEIMSNWNLIHNKLKHRNE